MYTNQAKEISKLQLAGLLVGIGLAASIQFRIRLIPFNGSFFSYASILYFLAGLLFGFFIPGLSWKGGIWIARQFQFPFQTISPDKPIYMS